MGRKNDEGITGYGSTRERGNYISVDELEAGYDLFRDENGQLCARAKPDDTPEWEQATNTGLAIGSAVLGWFGL